MKKIFHSIIIEREGENLFLKMPSKDIFAKKIKHTFGLKKDFVKTLKVIVSEDKEMKSNPQLAYFHAEVLFKCVIAYNQLGWLITTPEQAKSLLKEQTKFYTEIINNQTGETIKNLKSFAKAEKQEMINIIEYAIIEVCGTAGVDVQSPEDYYLLKKNI